MRLEAHPATNVFPMANGKVYAALKEDVRENGLREPIALYDGQILDGRARDQICEELGIKPWYRDVDLEDQTPGEYVVEKNLPGKDLTVVQRAAIGVEILPEVQAIARERIAEGGQKSKRGQPQEKGTPEEEAQRKKDGQTGIQVARMLGIGHSTLFAAKAIARKNPDLLPKMRSGEIPTVAEAARLAGFEYATQGGSGVGRITVRDARGKTPNYGKGDKWLEASTPLRRYLKGWETRNFEFRSVNPREAARRLKQIAEIEEGLARVKADLESRSHKATLSLPKS